jgi:Arc/MetJ family transcription regulator
MMLFLMPECGCWPYKDAEMRTTVTLDDELLTQAQEYTGLKEKSALLNEALKRLVQREAARRLALLGGTMPDAKAPPRRRFGGP